MRFRLAAAPSASGRFPVLCFVSVLKACGVLVPVPMCIVGTRGPGLRDRQSRLRLQRARTLCTVSTSFGRNERQPRSGVSSTIFDMD